MSILIFAEQSEGKFKKATYEAASYAFDLAQAKGEKLEAVSIGSIPVSEIESLGRYGISKVYHIDQEKLNGFVNQAYASLITHVANHIEAKTVVFSQTYNARAIAPRVAIKMDASVLSGISTLPTGDSFESTRSAYSGKGIEHIQAQGDRHVITLKSNAWQVKENPVTCIVESFDYVPEDKDFGAIATALIKTSGEISLTEADIVVSAGRGLKGPENWGMIEELAKELGAATACSKPVSDVHWRPHHEHVGQTGIQIAPKLYIAIGISGAIQHLAGVNASKVIVVINKDPEAPFFKAADYGIVGDAFEVVPKLILAVKSLKNKQF
jgi:electron transfer flavoprotein alpha subunit